MPEGKLTPAEADSLKARIKERLAMTPYRIYDDLPAAAQAKVDGYIQTANAALDNNPLTTQQEEEYRKLALLAAKQAGGIIARNDANFPAYNAQLTKLEAAEAGLFEITGSMVFNVRKLGSDLIIEILDGLEKQRGSQPSL